MRDRDYSDSLSFLGEFFRHTAGEDETDEFAGNVEFRVIANEGGIVARLATRDPLELVPFLQRHDQPGRAVYFACCTRIAGSHRGRREDLRECVGLWLDIDCYKLGIRVEDAARALNLRWDMRPTAIVRSGGGVHAYWLFPEPLPLPMPAAGELDEIKMRIDAALSQLAGVFAGDPVPAQVAAVMRLPGTHNSKTGEMVECVVLQAAWECRYELGNLEDILFECKPLLEAQNAVPNKEPNKRDQETAPSAERDPFLAFAKTYAWKQPIDVEQALRDMTYGDKEHGIHPTQLKVSGSLVNAPGVSDDQIVELLMHHTERCAPPNARWNWQREAREILKMTLRMRDRRRAEGKDPYPQPAVEPPLPNGVVPFELRPRRQEKEEERPDNDPLPALKVTAQKPTMPIRVGQIAATADMAERLLVDAAAPFYSRTSRIVRPVIEDDWAADGIKTKVARLVPVGEAGLIDYLSRLGNWVKYSKTEKNWVPTEPPKILAEIVLSREGEWLVPPVAGVITTPTLRPDGTILREEGYDAATRLVLLKPPPMPIIPPQPSKDDAVAALALLTGLLSEFCFTDEASRSVAISTMMTPIVRGALPVAPAHVARAPVAGSGKSYLIDIAAAIATGQRCPVISSGKDEMEQEKRIGAVLMGGQPLVSIDNLNGELRGDALCQMVERPLVQIRVLGKSILMRIETRATLFATGNNIVVVGDMVRRTLMMSMDANVERPEQRVFKQRPVEIVLADRGRYIAAVMTIVRAYHQAGYPGALTPLASYDQWSLMVRSALVWLGMPDPVLTMETARSEDPELSALRDIVNGWHAASCRSDGEPDGVLRSVSQIIALSEQREVNAAGHENYEKFEPGELLFPEFREALADVAPGGKGVDPRKLGWWLGRQKNRQIDGLKILGERDAHAKAMRWRLGRP